MSSIDVSFASLFVHYAQALRKSKAPTFSTSSLTRRSAKRLGFFCSTLTHVLHSTKASRFEPSNVVPAFISHKRMWQPRPMTRLDSLTSSTPFTMHSIQHQRSIPRSRSPSVSNQIVSPRLSPSASNQSPTISAASSRRPLIWTRSTMQLWLLCYLLTLSARFLHLQPFYLTQLHSTSLTASTNM